jgi:ribosome maturation factor RimP
MPSGTPRPTALLALVTPVVEAAGFDLEELTVTSVGRRSLVRVVIDGDEGIDLDAIASVSRAVSGVLDEDPAADLIQGAYELEVTSPGVDRPLTEPRHWRRAAGRLVAVDIDGKRVVGRVLSSDTAGVVLALSGTSRAVTWSSLGSGRVQVEFNRDNAAPAPAEEG